MEKNDAVSRAANALARRGFAVTCFDSAEQAAAWLDSRIDGTTVGMGGSVTLREMGLYESLSRHNRVFWHWEVPSDSTAAEQCRLAQTADVYLSSVNGLAESGELINIDGSGNRVSAIQYGHKTVYLVVGENKLAPDYEAALYRARNVAAPLNARRLGRKTPCAANGGRCCDCQSPERICRGLSVLWEKPSCGDYHVVLVREKLGY